MACLKKLILLAKYQQELRGYAESVAELKAHTAAIPVAEYTLLVELAKRTLEKCETAQRHLQRHILDHGC